MYRNYYKCALRDGISHGFDLTSDLELELGDSQKPCAYITRMFDTGDPDTTYHRLFVDGDWDKVKLEIFVAVTNTPDATVENGIPLQSLLGNTQASPAKKEAVLRRMQFTRQVNTSDMLLHTLKGRYVWIFLAVYPESFEARFHLKGLRLEFPQHSFTEYFPEIYQGNDFFERYVAVFQTMFLDEEKRVDELPGLLDYEGTAEPYVKELASWLGVDDPDNLYTTEQLRQIIRDIDLYQGGKGTKKALVEMIRLITGIEPRIAEPFQWNRSEMSPQREKQYRSLYGETDNHFCVILDVMDKEDALPLSEQKLEKLIRAFSMVGTSPRLVLLTRCSHTDGHCYLGINSTLSTPEIAAVDRTVLGDHITVG